MIKALLLVSCVTACSIQGAQTLPYSFAQAAVNVDGFTTFLSRDGPTPPGMTLNQFNFESGLGIIKVRVAGAGWHHVGVLVDCEIEENTNTFYNEYANVVGIPTGGQTWEVDEPGFRTGQLLRHFQDAELQNTNRVAAHIPDDVGVAMAWDLALESNEVAIVEFTVGETATQGGFYVVQVDARTGRSLFFEGTLRKQTGDTEPPTILCPTNLVLEPDPGQCVRTNVTYTVSATDNLPGVNVTCQPPSGARFDTGMTSIRCVATDAEGNTNACSFTVTIRSSPPTIRCPQNIVMECAPPGGLPVQFNVTGSAGCASSFTINCMPPSGTIFPVGPTAVQCTGVDSSGGRVDCSFTVLLVGTNCQGEFSLTKSTCLAGEVHADPLLFPYPCGTCVRVDGVAAEGWVFMGWLGDARGLENSSVLTMTQSRCVEAIFGSRLTIVGADHGVGWLDPAVDLYPCGSPVRALARPEPNYFFSHWTNALSGSLNPTDFILAKTNAMLAPVFLPLGPGEFALTVETRGYGRVIGQPRLVNRYPVGSNVVLRAVPDAGQVFKGWSAIANDGSSLALGTNNSITVAMTTSQIVTASFTSRPRIEIFRCEGRLLKDGFRFQVRGKLEDVYSIQATPALDDPIPWREIARATNTLGAVQYDDPYLPSVSQRFYRVELIEP